MKGSTFYEEDYESFFWTASWWNSSDKYTRMTKTVKYHIRQSFPYSVALFIVNGSPADITFYCFLIERGFPLFLIGKNANSDNIWWQNPHSIFPWCCIIKVDSLFSRILIYNHNQYENRRNNLWHRTKNLMTTNLKHRR